MIELRRTSPMCAYWQGGRPPALTARTASVTEQPFLSKRLLRGIAASWQTTLPRQLGIELPNPNSVTSRDELSCLWLRPNEWLLISRSAASGLAFDQLAPDPAGATRASAAIDVSCRFASLKVAGACAAELLNSGCSIDFSERTFPSGHCCQTRIEEVPVIISRSSDSREFEVMPERALADYLWRWMSSAIREFA